MNFSDFLKKKWVKTAIGGVSLQQHLLFKFENDQGSNDDVRIVIFLKRSEFMFFLHREQNFSSKYSVTVGLKLSEHPEQILERH